MDEFWISNISQFFIIVFIFLILVGLVILADKKLIHRSNRFLNPNEYFPQEEIHSLKQIYYLIMLALCFSNFIYSFVYFKGDLFFFSIADIILSVFIAATIEKDTLFKKILVLLLVPYGSFVYFIFNLSIVSVLDIVHILIFIYFIRYYYNKFRDYTESNGLGITIILLFLIIFVSFLVTSVVESVNPLDAISMVSNAFTSNGYTVLGNTIVGKLNSLVLVWGGYILSGVGTATLTAAILTRHFNKRFDELEKLIEKNNKE